MNFHFYDPTPRLSVNKYAMLIKGIIETEVKIFLVLDLVSPLIYHGNPVSGGNSGVRENPHLPSHFIY